MSGGTVQYTATTRSSVATYSCALGFILEGVGIGHVRPRGHCVQDCGQGIPPDADVSEVGVGVGKTSALQGIFRPAGSYCLVHMLVHYISKELDVCEVIIYASFPACSC